MHQQLIMKNYECIKRVLSKITKYFQVRLDQAIRLDTTPSLDEKIELYNMTEDVLWRDLDR